jgi:hypothetical protein
VTFDEAQGVPVTRQFMAEVKKKISRAEAELETGCPLFDKKKSWPIFRSANTTSGYSKASSNAQIRIDLRG